MAGKLGTSGRPLTRDAARALALLVAADGRPVTLAELGEHGVRFPGQAVYELQLAGYAIDRTASGAGPRLGGYRVAVPAAG